MKHIQQAHRAIQQASHETTRLLTAQVRHEAQKSGWPRHIVANMGVTYGTEGFETHVHERHFNEAHKLEYGTETSRPTAAVRRHSNRTDEAEQFFVGALHKMIGDL